MPLSYILPIRLHFPVYEILTALTEHRQDQ